MRTSRRIAYAALAAGLCLGTAVSTGAPAVAAATASLYVVQGVDGTTMALSVDGRRVAAAAEAKAIVGPLRLEAGRHVVTATPVGGGGAVQATVSLSAGSSTDVVLHRQADATRPPRFTTYTNDLSSVTPGSSRLTVAHTAAVGPADIRVRGEVLFSNVANGEQLSLTVPAGTYPVDIVPTAADGPVVFGPADVRLERSTLTRVFAIGVAATDSMAAVVQVLPVRARGSDVDPTRVDAGDGGQAQGLIAAHTASARTNEGAPAVGPALVLLVLAGLGLLLVTAHRARPLRARWGRPGPPRPRA